MLLEYQLVPETIARPRSFAGLMSLYESNYLRLQQLVPELERLDGYYRSRVAGACDLHVDPVLARRSSPGLGRGLSLFPSVPLQLLLPLFPPATGQRTALCYCGCGRF